MSAAYKLTSVQKRAVVFLNFAENPSLWVAEELKRSELLVAKRNASNVKSGEVFMGRYMTSRVS